MVLRRSLAVLAVVALVSAGVVARQQYARGDADRFQKKLSDIVQYGEVPPEKRKRPAPRSLQVSDVEVNAYLRHHGRDQVPTGVVDPTINALGEGRLTGRALVDLDAVRKSKQRGWTDPLGYLTGRLPVNAAGRLTTKDGVGRFELESASVSGVPVPKAVLQELLSFYSKTPQDPDGINMDDPFELPARIREIRVAKGAATVVQ